LGLAAAITNFIPYVGPIFGFIPAVVIALVDQSGQATLGAMIILYLVTNIIDLVFIFPVLVARIVNLHPVLVVISVIIGSSYSGAIGMIISIPIASVLKLVFEEIVKEFYPQNLRNS
jgi:putative permease